MFEFIEKAVGYLQSGNYVILLVAVIASLIYKALPLLEAYHAYRKRRVIDLENTIKSEHISTSFKNILKDEIECEHFKIVYGVRAQKPLIDQIFILHKKINGKKTLNQFANALRLYPKVIKKSDNSYHLKAGALDYIFGAYHLLMGLLFLIVGFIALTTQLDIGLFALGGRPLILSLVVIGGGIYMLYMSTPVYSLMTINRALKTRS